MYQFTELTLRMPGWMGVRMQQLKWSGLYMYTNEAVSEFEDRQPVQW